MFWKFQVESFPQVILRHSYWHTDVKCSIQFSQLEHYWDFEWKDSLLCGPTLYTLWCLAPQIQAVSPLALWQPKSPYHFQIHLKGLYHPQLRTPWVGACRNFYYGSDPTPKVNLFVTKALKMPMVRQCEDSGLAGKDYLLSQFNEWKYWGFRGEVTYSRL